MGEGRTGEPRTNHRLTVRQAAARLGITEGAVRSRIKRGTLRTEKVGDRVLVVLGDEPSGDPRRTTGEPSDRTRLVEVLEGEIAYLRRQLEEANVRDRENRRIIAAITSRIPELEAPRESPTPSAEASEGSEARSHAGGAQREATDAERPRVPRPPWWRRMFGG